MYYEFQIRRGNMVRPPAFRIGNTGDGAFQFPYVLPVAIAIGGVVIFAWPRSTRFSLRTMLIATTLVAVLLGLGVWLAS